MVTLQLNCIVCGESPRRMFTIEVSNDQTVTALQGKIRTDNLNTFKNVDARNLELYKMDIQIDVNDPDKCISIYDGSHRQLIGYERLSNVFVANNLSPANIHIVVQPRPPETGCGPSEDECRELHNALNALKPDAVWYCNPQHFSTLPFPFLSKTLPVERFRFFPNDCVPYFRYIGREQFGAVWENTASLLKGTGRTRLYISGTMGYGKSHILAALAGLLARSGHHVVFLPDAREMLVNPFSYLQTALLCGFADPASSQSRATIRSCQALEDLERFCLNDVQLIIIVDQINALEEEENHNDMISNEQKQNLHQLLRRLSAHHPYITAASTNHRVAQRMKQKQTNDLKIEMIGGMSLTEVQYWWIHYSDEVPIFNDEERQAVENITGCIPLLLRPLLGLGKQHFCDVAQSFWSHRDIMAISQHITQYSAKQEICLGRDYEKYYIEPLFACLAQKSSLLGCDEEYFDVRYFYPSKDGTCRSTCGLAKEAGARRIRLWQPKLFLKSEWFEAMQVADGNPDVIGFIIKQACLSAISCEGMGAVFRDLRKKSPKSGPILVDIFHDGSLFSCCGQTTAQQLLVPFNPFYHDIDAIYLNVDAEAKTVEVWPIQITIRRRHPNSEARFYSHWQDWTDHYQGFTLTSTFIRVVEDKCYIRKLPPRSRGTNSGSDLSATSHKQVCVAIKTLCPQVGEYLESFWHQRKGSNTLTSLPSHPDLVEQSRRNFKRLAAVPLENSMDSTTGVDMGRKRARKQTRKP